MSLSVVILAAGKGTRMRSRLPKVLHPVAGRPMLQHVLHTAHDLDPTVLSVVVSPGDDVRAALDRPAEVVVQSHQRGTGHAVAQAESVLAGRAETVLVLYGDTPLLTAGTLRRLVTAHYAQRSTITLLTTRIADPALRPNGRIVRDSQGGIVGVVEAPEATPEQRDIDECNMGIYAFRDDWLWPSLARVEPSAVKGEIYLTSLIGMAITEGCPVGAVMTDDYQETLGVDTRALLAEAESVMRRRLALYWMERGVTLQNPTDTYIDIDADIGVDTTLLSGAHLLGRTRVGSGCVIGPHVILRNAVLGNDCRVEMAVVEDVAVADGVVIRPFTHLSPQ